LDKTEVRAPFDGIVVLKDAEVGEVVSPNSQGGNSRGSVATMVDWASLEVQVELQQTSLSAAQLDTAANVYLDAYPDQAYTGRVTRIWPTANRQKATVEVRVSFDRPDERLKPDLGVRVVFSPKPLEGDAGAQRETVVVARGAVAKIDGQAGVFELERDVARWKPVTLGGEGAGRVAVERGLAGGERLVLDPPVGLRDGDRVWIEE
jgi:RND family efflux transporter MFP subunit